jgi:hypothetical protein
MLKPVPASTVFITLTGVWPVFVKVTGSELAEPTFALTVKFPGATASEGASATPAHPAHIKLELTNASTSTMFLWRGFISLDLPLPKLKLFICSGDNKFRPPSGGAA